MSSVFLKLGPLSGVVKEALLFSYQLACEGTPLEGSSLIVEDIPIRIYCTECEAETAPVSLQCLECSQCGRAAARVTRGDDLELSALELQAL